MRWPGPLLSVVLIEVPVVVLANVLYAAQYAAQHITAAVSEADGLEFDGLRGAFIPAAGAIAVVAALAWPEHFATLTFGLVTAAAVANAPAMLALMPPVLPIA